jgi:hypothetical protein
VDREAISGQLGIGHVLTEGHDPETCPACSGRPAMVLGDGTEVWSEANAERIKAHARTTDPSTSHEAAASVVKLTDKRRAVLEVMLNVEGPICDADLMSAYDDEQDERDDLVRPEQSVSGIRTRRSELVRMGLVEDSGDRVTIHGRQHTLWQLTERGFEVATGK